MVRSPIEMDVVVATDDRIDEIASLLRLAYAEFAPPPGDSDRPSWDDYYDHEIPDVRGRWPFTSHLIVVEDDAVIGTACYIPDAADERMAEDRWPEGYAAMRLLGVHPRARGRGIGRRLTEACLARAREQGAEWFGLHTTHLMSVARGMYERLGFERFPDNDIPVSDTFVVIAYRTKLA
ncbi:MAG TPA: GNAT family N-acetyltransferase [Actinomycetota bacterium]|nr:GNAT family N-acetyltransferase [Actinomycetota bacterium]